MIGKVLGNRYEIVEKIAQGGMSVVYKALDLKLNRYDAVKVLNKEFLNNEEILERFKQEANAVAFLSHPNIVNIYNVGSEDNVHYIVMEYVKGKTLKELIREKGKLSNDEIIDYSLQIGRALECAHNNNIIHRDIKPQNIMITGDGLVKVTDFGIAKHSDSSTITNSGKIIGSAHYFSPEQARGILTDGRSDIYSLGIVMFEMATGGVPFDAESPITIALKHMQEAIKAPKSLNPALNDGINSVILKATLKDPFERYQRIEDFLKDMRTLRAGERVLAPVSTANGETQVMSAVKPSKPVYEVDDDIFDDDRPSGKKRTALIVGLVMVLFLTLGALLGQYVFGGGPGKEPGVIATDEVKVPEIVGKSEAEAEAELTGVGLLMAISSTENSDIAEGTILRILPEAGTPVKKGSSVNVVVSAGQVQLRVPSLIGQTVESAETVLANNNLIKGVVTEEFSESVPKGQIISHEPAANAEAPKGSAINLLISKGPEVLISKVPDLVKLTQDEAKGLLESVMLQLGDVTMEPTTDKTLNATIKSQGIPADTEVKQGSKVKITVYEYKEVVIGNYIKLTVAEAKSALIALGLKVELTSGTQSTDKVVTVSPGKGSTVPVGSTVTIEGQEDAPPEPPVEEEPTEVEPDPVTLQPGKPKKNN
jgi:serine/threonine-protein kinase